MYNEIYTYLSERGVTKKKARETARAIIPNMAATEFIWTINLRTAREFIQKRNFDGADAEIRIMASDLLYCLHEEYPSVFKDLMEMDREFTATT